MTDKDDEGNNVVPIGGNGAKPPPDTLDIACLWLDAKLGDGLVNIHFHSVPVGKPKAFFRVNPDPAYRKLTEVYIHKPEDSPDEQTYIIAPQMRGVIEEARRCTLVTCIYRDGTPRLWPLKLPKEGEKDNEAWKSARSAAKTAFDKWVKLLWQGGRYHTRDAQPGYAPDPDWRKLPAYDDLVRLAFGEHNIIQDKKHPIVQELFGAPSKKSDGDDGIC